MRLLVISSAPFIKKEDGIYAYSPYVKELEVWRKNVDEIAFACPFWNHDKNLLVSKIPFTIDTYYPLKEFDFLAFLNGIKAVPILIMNCIILYKCIKKSDMIHLRCPGNMSLLGCIIQILFPGKIKSAKYAGNWDANSKQPLSYRIQKMILSNTFLTRNIKVLVYGEWKHQSKNIISFFTASYFESEIEEVAPRNLNEKIQFLFVGTLSKGKQPLYAVKIIEKLKQLGHNVQLSMFGEGKERDVLLDYISTNELESFVFLKGNVDRNLMKVLYKTSHFVLLPSKSEGWPKVVAEAMFWGCLPIVTKISCVPNMLDNGKRGILLEETFEKDIQLIRENIMNQKEYNEKLFKAINWSRNFTIDRFESEIKQIMQS